MCYIILENLEYALFSYRQNSHDEERKWLWIIHSLVILQTETLFETYQSPEQVVKRSRGVGLVIGRHVLTLNHVVTQYGLQYVTPFGPVSIPAKKKQEKTYLRKLILKDLLRDRELDIALFEIPVNDLNLVPLSCPVGNSDELTLGTFVYIVGNPFNSGLNVRDGIVSSLVGPEGVTQIPAKSGDHFMISNGVLPGDSGAPVLALRNGVLELVGLVQGTIANTRLGWAIKINPTVRKLSGHLDREGLYLVQKDTSSIQ